MDAYVDNFANKVKVRSDNLQQFLSPLIGIMVNLYSAVNTLGLKNNDLYDNLADILVKTDSFESDLFRKLNELVISKLPPQNQDEVKIFSAFSEQMVLEIEMLAQSNKLRKLSSRNRSLSMEEGGMKEE